jgi:hypothetical protein
MKKIIVLLCISSLMTSLSAQDKSNAAITDPEAGAILEKAAVKYQTLKWM